MHGIISLIFVLIKKYDFYTICYNAKSENCLDRTNVSYVLWCKI